MGPKIIKNTIILISMVLGLTWSVAVAAPPLQTGGNANDAFLRLQYGTFDPVIGVPSLPQHLALTDFSNGGGTYIVQFDGPVQAQWKEAVAAAGGQIDGYLPDYAFIVKLDGNTRAQVEQLSFVRWVGIYQPAYKMSPQLTASPINLYRLSLTNWADIADVRNQLISLGLDVRGDGSSLVVHAEFAQLAQIARLPDVLWIEQYQFFETYNDVGTGIMNATPAWNLGYTGNGQMLTVADTGLDTGVDNPGANGDIHLDFDNRVAQISSWPVVSNPCYTNSGADDGAADVASGHGTHVAGSAGGNGARSGGQYKGTAYEATLTFQAIQQFTTISGPCGGPGANGYYLTGIPDDLNDLFQEAYNWGSRIHTNSWGSNVNGQYTISSQQADQFTWNNKNFAILFAAGNEGRDADSNGYVDEDSLGSPATAKNVITIGASENDRSSGGLSSCSYGLCFSGFPNAPTSTDLVSDDPDEMAAFSSRGPTDDGRIKPDLVAPGTNILSTRSISATGTGWGTPLNQYYMYNGGTSMATPLAAGGAAVVRDFLVDGEGLPNPSAALIKAILINSAVDIDGYGNSNQEAGQPIPNNHEGWGRIDLTAAVSNTDRLLVDNQSLTTDMTHSYNVTVTTTVTPLKTTLVWTDYQGSAAGGIQLVNNLNLKVTAPNGTTIYRGNNFSNGWSATGGGPDTINNVENVYVQSPATGVWTVEVSGFNVPQGPQPYALIISGHDTSGSGGGTGGGAEFIYLPIIMKTGGTTSGGSINNGDFESGATGWTESSSNGFDLILPSAGLPVTPHSGNWAVWLGGFPNETSYIQQQVTVSSVNPYLAYWHWIGSADSCGFDFGGVAINGSNVESYSLCTSSNTSGWVKRVVNLSAYAGQSVTLRIWGTTDSSLNSNLFIDDVAFQVSATATEAPGSGVPASDSQDTQPKAQSDEPDGNTIKRK